MIVLMVVKSSSKSSDWHLFVRVDPGRELGVSALMQSGQYRWLLVNNLFTLIIFINIIIVIIIMIKLLLKNGRWFLQSSPASSLSSFSSLLWCPGYCHCHCHRLCIVIVIVIVIVTVIVFVMIVIVLLTATIPGGASRSRWSPARTWPTLSGILSADLLEGRYNANWPLFPL